MKRYLLFKIDFYYPAGGLDDLILMTDSLQAVQDKVSDCGN
jgi:hypothetical protein